ncbi:MAG: ABC transporter permease [Opitutales bacterium]
MPPPLRIALRFILSRQRSMLMSLAGIVFGVGFFIITQAQTAGFEQYYIQTIIGTDSPIRITERIQGAGEPLRAGEEDADFILSSGAGQPVEGVAYPQRLRTALNNFSAVTGVSEVIRGEAAASGPDGSETARINGIRLRDHISVTNLEGQIVAGALSDFAGDPSRVMLGVKLAARLGVDVGDFLLLETSVGSRRYRVVAIFESGIDLIDSRRIFMHLSEARSLLRQPFGGALFQVNVRDPDDAPELAARMQEVLNHNVISWQERERTWLEVFAALKASSALTVSTIILISGLGMFNTLAMLVLEKTREIAILRSMGYTRPDVTQIFLWQGTLVLIAGTLVGWAFGAAVTWGVSHVPIRIRGIFSTDSFVVAWDINHYIWAAVISSFVVMAASYLPARKAARLEPGAIIRGAGQ